jgi:hypothetical protein
VIGVFAGLVRSSGRFLSLVLVYTNFLGYWRQHAWTSFPSVTIAASYLALW